MIKTTDIYKALCELIKTQRTEPNYQLPAMGEGLLKAWEEALQDLVEPEPKREWPLITGTEAISSRRNFLIIGGCHPGKSGLSFLTAQTGRPIILNLEQDQDELKEKLQALMEMEPYKPVYINPDLEVGIKDIHTSNQPFYKNVGKKGGNKNRKGGRKF